MKLNVAIVVVFMAICFLLGYTIYSEGYKAGVKELKEVLCD